MKNLLLLSLSCICTALFGQSVGIGISMPDAPIHLYGSGQVETPGGLVLIGNRQEAHMEVDFDRLQSLYGTLGTTLPLRLQPDGGNIGIGLPFPQAVDYPLTINGSIGINDYVYHNGDSDTWMRLLDDDIILNVGGIQMMRLIEGVQDVVHIAIGSEIDVNIGAGAIFLDGATSQVGIGDLTPTARLNIAASAAEVPLRVQQNGTTTVIVDQDAQVGIGDATPDARLDVSALISEVALRIEQAGNTRIIVASSGQVGIGDPTPAARLDVSALISEVPLRIEQAGNTRIIVASSGQVGIGDATPAARLNIDTDAGEVPLRVQQNGSTRFFVHSNGFIGAGGGFYTPESTMHIQHNNSNVETQGLSIGNGTDVRWQFYANANQNLSLYGDNDINHVLHGTFLWALGDYVPASDLRVKKNIESLEPVLDRLMQLQPRKYNMLIEQDDAAKSFGFIAQEVCELFPENVRYDEGSDKWVVLYKGFGVLAVKAIQELTDEVRRQDAMIQELLDQQQAMSASIARLEALIVE